MKSGFLKAWGTFGTQLRYPLCSNPAGILGTRRGSADPHVPSLATASPQGHLLGKAAPKPGSGEQVREREHALGSVRHAARALPVFGRGCQEDESQPCVCRPSALSCARALPSCTCCSHSSSHGPNLPPPCPGPGPTDSCSFGYDSAPGSRLNHTPIPDLPGLFAVESLTSDTSVSNKYLGRECVCRILLRRSGEPYKDDARCGPSRDTELSQVLTQPLAGGVAWAQRVPALGPGCHVYTVDGNHRACLTSAIQAVHKSDRSAYVLQCQEASRKQSPFTRGVLFTFHLIYPARLGLWGELCDEKQTRPREQGYFVNVSCYNEEDGATEALCEEVSGRPGLILGSGVKTILS